MMKVPGFAIFVAFSPLLSCAQEATASLTGAVQDPTGVGVWGGPVILESGGVAVGQTKTDEQGVFRFSGLTAGKYTLSILARGFAPLKIAQDLLAGELRSLPPVKLVVARMCFFDSDANPERTQFLSTGSDFGGFGGSVRNEQGPVAGARVALCWWASACVNAPSTKTDIQGAFKFESVFKGAYVLSIEPEGLGGNFYIVGGLENHYSFKRPPCPNGDCTVKQDPNIKPFVCE